GAPGPVAFNPTTNELWVTSSGSDAGTQVAALTVLDGTTFAVKRVAVTGKGTFQAIAVAPDTNKVYLARSEPPTGGFRGEIDVGDGVSSTATTVAPFAANFEQATSLAYDATSHRLYAAISGGYLQQIDTTNNTLITTFPKPAGLGGFGRVGLYPGD